MKKTLHSLVLLTAIVTGSICNTASALSHRAQQALLWSSGAALSAGAGLLAKYFHTKQTVGHWDKESWFRLTEDQKDEIIDTNWERQKKSTLFAYTLMVLTPLTSAYLYFKNK